MQSDASTLDAAVLRFLLRLARALQGYGMFSGSLEAVLSRVASHYGVKSQFFITLTAVIATFGPAEDMRTTFLRVSPGWIDLERIALLDQLLDDILHQDCDVETANQRLTEILRQRPTITRAVRLLAPMMGAPCWMLLLGGGVREMALAMIVSFLVGVWDFTQDLWTTRPWWRREILFGAVVSLLAYGVPRVLGVPMSSPWVVLATLIPLFPGVGLVLGVKEVAVGHLLSGGTRLLLAAVVFLEILFGVALGRELADLLIGNPIAAAVQRAPSSWLPVALVGALLSGAVLFRARLRDLPWLLFAGFVGFYVSRWASKALGAELGAFVGAFVVGAVSNLVGRLRRVSPLVMMLPGVFVLLPGTLGFRSVLLLWNNNAQMGISTAFSVVLVAIGISVGLGTASSMLAPRRAHI